MSLRSIPRRAAAPFSSKQRSVVKPETPVDKRKARRFYRRAAKTLMGVGSLLNPLSPPGSIPWSVAAFYRRKAQFHRR